MCTALNNIEYLIDRYCALVDQFLPEDQCSIETLHYMKAKLNSAIGCTTQLMYLQAKKKIKRYLANTKSSMTVSMDDILSILDSELEILTMHMTGSLFTKALKSLWNVTLQNIKLILFKLHHEQKKIQISSRKLQRVDCLIQEFKAFFHASGCELSEEYLQKVIYQNISSIISDFKDFKE